MKLCGLGLVALCAVCAGLAMSLSLTERVKALELARAVLESFARELEYSLAPPDAIVTRLARRETLSAAGYLPACQSLCARGIPFPEAWREAVRDNPGSLSPEDTRTLAGPADTLGRCGAEEELAALGRAREALAVSLEEAREYARTHGKLYRTLGMLSGAFLVILWI